MSDKQSNRSLGRTRISLDEEDVRHFAERHSLPEETAVEIIKAVDGDLPAADEAAKRYTASV